MKTVREDYVTKATRCPDCGTCMRYHRKAVRRVKDINENGEAVLRIIRLRVGLCPKCVKFHHYQPPGTVAHSRYGLRVWRKARALLEQGHSLVAVRAILIRDHGLPVPTTTLHECKGRRLCSRTK